MAELWVLCEGLSRAANLDDEVETEAGGVSLVEPCGRQELCFRLWVEDDTSHRSDDRALRNTLAADLPLTLPVRSSSSRRSASRTHTASASASASLSRLAMRRSASRARSRGESFSALDSS